MLGWQYERASQIHAATDPRSQWQAETRVMTGEPTVARLLARLDFTPVRYFFEMLASTAAASGATLPAGLRSEALAPGIERPLYDADTEAFTDHWGYQRHDFDSWGSTMVGTAGSGRTCPGSPTTDTSIAGYILSYRDNDPGRIYIGRIGTRRPGAAGAWPAR